MIDQLFCGLVFRHNVLSNIVQNGLPALALLFLRMRRLSIKCDTHRDAVFCRHELDDATRSPKAYSISLSGTILVYVSERRTGFSEIDIVLQFFLTVQARGTNPLPCRDQSLRRQSASHHISLGKGENISARERQRPAVPVEA